VSNVCSGGGGSGDGGVGGASYAAVADKEKTSIVNFEKRRTPECAIFLRFIVRTSISQITSENDEMR